LNGIGQTQKSTEGFLLPIFDAILMICECFEIVFEMRNLKVGKTFRGKAKGEFV
jgi:hypothetical protein